MSTDDDTGISSFTPPPIVPIPQPPPAAEPPTFSFATPQEAAARKSELMKTPGFAQRFFDGDVSARREIDAINHALAQVSDPARTAREFEVAGMEGRYGITQRHLDDYRNGVPVTPEIRREAEGLKAALFRDRAWVAKYFDGDREAARQVDLLSLVLTAPVKAE
jgi:hypothetical protein